MDLGYEFHVDEFNSRVATGWIFLTEAPDQPVRLNLEADGRIIKEFQADIVREDLATQRVGGHGRCAFHVDLASLIDPLDHGPFELRLAENRFLIATLGGHVRGEMLSRFGGLWVDRYDFLKEASRRLNAKAFPQDLFPHIVDYAVNGYTVFRGLIDHALVDRINRDVDLLWEGSVPDSLIETYQVDGTLRYVRPQPQYKFGPNKLLDLYVFSEAARHAIFQPRLLTFLEKIFEDSVTAIQSLSFIVGSEQAIHKDTAYVRVFPPMHLAASWIALEDIEAGTGELEYYVGSHLTPDFLFGNKSKWMFRYQDEQEKYLQSLHDDAVRYGLKRERFLARKGDVLVWHADLAHGGSKIIQPGKTRKSLVAHYCPGSSRPFYETTSNQPFIAWGPNRFISGAVAGDIENRQVGFEAR